MPSQFSETTPGGKVSGTRTVRRQSRGLIVEYALEWTGGEPVRVRLVDRIPTADVEEYGFHEDHEPSEWTMTDGELDLETGLEPGDERRLVFGLMAEDAEAGSLDREAPVIVIVDRDDGGESDDAEPADAEGPDVDLSVDLEEPGSEEEGQEDVGPAPRRTPDGRRVDADGGVVNREPAADESVVSTPVAELEAGNVSESELSTLREHLGDGAESEAVRLEYVQKRLSDFDAYVDALEDLISVHGSGDDAITDLDERLDGLADEVGTVRSRQDELADRLETLSDALDEQAETLESHRTTHEADVEDLRAEIRRRGEALCEEFDDLQQSLDEDLAALEAEIEAFESIRRTLLDGLQRPDDPPAGTTVEDADPGALAETEEVPIVDPGETRDDGTAAVELDPPADDPAIESAPDSDDADDADAQGDDADDADAQGDDADDAAVGQSEVSVDLEESLETAEASNYSGSTDSPADGDGPAESEPDREEDGQFDEFVRPASDGRGDGTDEAAGDESTDATDEDGEKAAGDEDDEDFVVPGPDVDDADDDPGALDDGVAVGGEHEDGDVEVEDADVADATREDAPDEIADRDDDGDEADDDDSGGRASSIFEIGDVDSDGSDDDEMPTIDFEDP